MLFVAQRTAHISPVHSNGVINYAIAIRLFRTVLRDRLKNFWRNNMYMYVRYGELNMLPCHGDQKKRFNNQKVSMQDFKDFFDSWYGEFFKKHNNLITKRCHLTTWWENMHTIPRLSQTMMLFFPSPCTEAEHVAHKTCPSYLCLSSFCLLKCR